ncbi:MAG: hypothetical protein H7Z20_08470 [Bdellovibrio sp.]|nr:hypothetical protein [Methylotenera sp.]
MTAPPAPALQKTDVGILQLNLSYIADQDRLLLRVGLSENSELVVWLSYRISRMIWQLLNGEAHLPSANSIQTDTPPSQAVQQFQQEMQTSQALQKMDFQSPYTPRQDVVNNQPMLVTNVLLHSQDGKPQALEMPCLEGINVRVNLNQELILALCNMLQLSCKEAAWDLTSTPPMQVAAAPAITIEGDKKVLH